MTSAELTNSDIRDRVARALSKTVALESTYAPATVGQIVSRQARTHGSRIAIDIFERDERATYAEVDSRSNQYAHALRAFGVRKGDRIGVMLPNRIEFPILWFAIAKLGAVIVPLNTSYTPRELEHVLDDTQAKFTVVDESVSSTFWAMDPWPPHLMKERVILVGQAPSSVAAITLEALTAGVGDSSVESDVDPEDLLNIQYTSGTTGFPKGCMLTHDYWSVTSCVFANFDHEVYQRSLSWSPLFYTFGQMELMKSYRQGATLFIAQKLSSTRFLSWVRKYQIEYCDLPALIALQLEADDAAALCLKQVGQSPGWDLATIDHFRERCDAFGHNPYAMTEIGWGTQAPRELKDVEGFAGSVGIRAPFRELQLVTKDGRPAAVGEVGELWVRGRGIFKGYWMRPEANIESFHDGWFKTGDLLRRDELGLYAFVGRAKEVIRRSGESISAREVETVVSELPEVAAAAAVPVPDPKRGEEVKVCVELTEGLTPNDTLVQRIVEHLASRLASFKVPRYITFVSSLPRTASSNKVLKRELTNVSDPLAGAYDREEARWH